MELSLNVGYFGPHIANNHEYIKELDEIGVSCIWTAEAYGYDAVTPLSYFASITSNIELGAGIMQIPGRTPAMSAMTAVTIDKLSNGRFRLGLGVSGPQVVEGWHGIEYGKPLLKTREYIAVVREILNREKKVTYEGTYYNLPFNGERASGLGKPLKLIEHLIKLFSKKGSLIVDPFLGSGTTALACKNTERRCIGIELNSEYFTIAVDRVS